MRSRVGCGAAIWLLACGQPDKGSPQVPGSMAGNGAVSGAEAGGASNGGNAGTNTGGRSGANAIGGETSAGAAGTSAGGTSAGNGGAVGQCEPLVHERQQPGPLTSDFAAI